MTTTRAAIQYCPYCSDENLHPVEEHGAWECRSCLRAFSVKLHGLARREPEMKVAE